MLCSFMYALLMFTWTALTTFIVHLKNFFFIHYLYRYQQFQQEWPIYSAFFILGCYIVCEADADVSLLERRDASWPSSAPSSVQHPVPALLSLLVLTHALDYKYNVKLVFCLGRFCSPRPASFWWHPALFKKLKWRPVFFFLQKNTFLMAVTHGF